MTSGRLCQGGYDYCNKVVCVLGGKDKFDAASTCKKSMGDSIGQKYSNLARSDSIGQTCELTLIRTIGSGLTTPIGGGFCLDHQGNVTSVVGEENVLWNGEKF